MYPIKNVVAVSNQPFAWIQRICSVLTFWSWESLRAFFRGVLANFPVISYSRFPLSCCRPVGTFCFLPAPNICPQPSYFVQKQFGWMGGICVNQTSSSDLKLAQLVFYRGCWFLFLEVSNLVGWVDLIFYVWNKLYSLELTSFPSLTWTALDRYSLKSAAIRDWNFEAQAWNICLGIIPIFLKTNPTPSFVRIFFQELRSGYCSLTWPHKILLILWTLT